MMLVMRTTINSEPVVLEKAKAAALGRGVTLGEFIDGALRSYLSKGAQVAPPPFQLHTVRGELVQPSLDLDRTSALLVADDESAYGKSA
jgi:hypothetical protein